MNRKYSPEMRERALRMLAEARPEHANMMSAVRHVAGLLGMSPETLRLWQRRYEVDAGTKPGVTTDAVARIKQLEKENSELRKAEEILKAASVFSRRSSTAPDRDDPVHQRTPGSFRGRAHLPGPETGSPGLPHLPRLPRRHWPRAVRQATSRRSRGPRGREAARGELRRLRPPEDACASAFREPSDDVSAPRSRGGGQPGRRRR